MKASFSKECEVILGNLFVDLSLKFDEMEKVVSKNWMMTLKKDAKMNMKTIG